MKIRMTKFGRFRNGEDLLPDLLRKYDIECPQSLYSGSIAMETVSILWDTEDVTIIEEK